MIEPCLDMHYVKEFMNLPEVSRYAVEYGADLESEEFKNTGRGGWLVYSVGDEDIGLIKFYLCTGTMAMFHPYILRKNKKNYDVMAQEFFTWFIKNVPEQICKLNAAIPTIFPAAIKAAELGGMKREGIDRMSYLSKDGPCDRILLGITRGEIK